MLTAAVFESFLTGCAVGSYGYGAKRIRSIGMSAPQALTRRRLLAAAVGLGTAAGTLAACGDGAGLGAPTAGTSTSSRPVPAVEATAAPTGTASPAAGPPAGTRLPDIAARVRQAQGDVGILPPATAAASDSPIELPADIIAGRAERLVTLSERNLAFAPAGKRVVRNGVPTNDVVLSAYSSGNHAVFPKKPLKSRSDVGCLASAHVGPGQVGQPLD